MPADDTDQMGLTITLIPGDPGPVRRPRLVPLLLAAGLLAPLAACGSDGAGPGGTDGALTVEAAFYPLQWVAEQVGGDLVEVANLTQPGAEPHDLELSPKDVARLEEADVIAHLSSFQPAVDDAVTGSSATVFDAADAADLDLTITPSEGEGDSGDAGATDPHFWLDPTRLAAVGEAFAATLADQDPEHAATYRANAEALTAKLEELDAEFEAGLAECESTDLVTSHDAFGYLARRYDLRQVGIAGLTPDQEPSAGQLAEVTRFVEDNDVRTIYFETLASPAVAEAVASEADVRTEVLDPLEGLTDDSQGDDYLSVMRANLRNLRSGQSCA